MVLDEIESFFPNEKDNFEAALDTYSLKRLTQDNKSIRFHFLMRIGGFFEDFIQKVHFFIILIYGGSEN